MDDLKAVLVLHRHLVPDNQIYVSEDLCERALLRDTTYGRLVKLDRDLELGVRRTSVREQEGCNARRCYAKDRFPLPAEIVADRLI